MYDCAQVVFTSLALFSVLIAPLNSFPWVINGCVEAAVSVRRLQRPALTRMHCPDAEAHSHLHACPCQSFPRQACAWQAACGQCMPSSYMHHLHHPFSDTASQSNTCIDACPDNG